MDLIIKPGIVDEYDDAKHEQHPHGIIFINGKEAAHTLQCPHCGAHFVSRTGSGHRRAFCTKCNAVTCGSRQCDPCRPWIEGMQRLFGKEL